MIKIIGAVAIAIACFFAVREMFDHGRRRLAECEEFIGLLRHIRTRIGSYSAPLEAIYSDFDSEALARVGFADSLAQKGFGGALEECADRLAVGDEVLLALRNFSSELGCSYREDQLASCDYYISELERALSECRGESSKRTKLAGTLTVTFGLMVIIVLI